jgi:hypothetical protein
MVRTSAFFGPWDRHNFVTGALQALAEGRPFAAADDMIVSPTYVPDLVHACLDLLIDRESGIWHLTNDAALSWAQLVQRAAALAGLETASLRPCPSTTLALAAPQPRFSALGSERGILMPTLDNALQRYLGGLGELAEGCYTCGLGLVAQLVEQRIENPCVGGSIPPRATKNMPHATPIHADRRFCFRNRKSLCPVYFRPIFRHAALLDSDPRQRIGEFFDPAIGSIAFAITHHGDCAVLSGEQAGCRVIGAD